MSDATFLPPPPDRYDRSWMSRMLEMVGLELNSSLRKDKSNSEVLLMSPDGKVWSLTVSNTGVVTATYVRG